MLATALAYLDLLRATQQLRIAEATRDNAKKLADLTAKFASTGQGPQADADRSRFDQARALQVSMMDRVAREIVEAHVQVQSRNGQIDVAKSGVKSATDSYERNVARIREGEGLPIEVLQSLQALDESRREYLRKLADPMTNLT